MKIGISGAFWGSITTGSGQHLRGLLPALVAAAPQDQFRLYLPAFGDADTAQDDSPMPTTRLYTPFDASSPRLAKVWFEQISLPRAAAHDRLDVLHVPYQGAPALHRVPVVVTIHDMIHQLFPDYRRSLGMRAYMHLADWSGRRSQQIIAVSHSAAQDIRSHLGVRSERVQTVYNAVSPNLVPPSEQQLQQTAEKLALPQRYLLYLGGFDRRKRVELLLQGYAQLHEQLEGIPLVIAGRLPAPGSAVASDPREIIQALGLDERVLLLGGIAEEDKAAIYALADALVFPSIYEGFGLPVLEAMACGCPVITTLASSLPEVGGQAARYVPPDDAGALAEAILEVTTRPELRAAMRAAGLERARMFSWRRSAAETLTVYQKALMG
ncbi:MAG: glycosyltransferase family 4 protein [Chloroflexi bacterium]|nr:glycosyltransferase family 4 protein [Chloroflexota bacterium]